ncbi:CHAT domain-containing protein [uncultured Tateyamaria sp.]|uniref:CHAT domain-containing protein n=1 Tax=uncultured Tateyamaria sp. TaxID=455651 RepID=UPI002626F131|nr:CHAT domain-containing protein [uncultured Tateyamaria sp.]
MYDLSNWRQLSADYGFVLPDVECPISVPQIPGLLVELNNLQAAAQATSFDELHRVSATVAEEIIQAQANATGDVERVLLEYVQFEVSIAPMMAAIKRGRFDSAFDWIHNGLSDSIESSAQRKFFDGRPFRFIGVLVDMLPNSFPNTFLEWADGFFYYCRNQSALFAPAAQIAPLLEETIFRLPADGSLAVKAAVSLMCWGRDVGHQSAVGVATVLRRLYDNDALPRENKAQIAKAFSTRSCDLVGDPHHRWAKIVIRDYADFLLQHEPFQYHFASFENVGDWDENVVWLIEAAKEYSDGVRNSFPSYTDWLISLDQRSSLLSPVAKFALDNDRSADFAKILAAWYDGEIETASAGCSVVLPTAISGVGFLGNDTEMVSFRGKFSGETEVVEAMNETTNNALGTTRTVQAGPELDAAPERPGQPNRDCASAFEGALFDFYNVPVLAEKLAGSPAFTCFPHNLHPLQALLSRETNECRPLSSSLRTPLPDRPIRRAAIWASCDDWYSEMEAASASDFLQRHGVEAHVYLGRESGRDDFLAMYRDPAYDFIHIIGHGAFDHWQLGSSKILVNQGEVLAVDDLVDLHPEKERRRLLCLNICDGGVSDGLGGIQKLGLAPSLASPAQAAVSHLWPVEPRVASAFGLTICSELVAAQNDHFGAFAETLKRVREPWVQRVTALREQFDGEIMDRLEIFNAPDDIFDWASPVFFQ